MIEWNELLNWDISHRFADIKVRIKAGGGFCKCRFKSELLLQVALAKRRSLAVIMEISALSSIVHHFYYSRASRAPRILSFSIGSMKTSESSSEVPTIDVNGGSLLRRR
jgi:hypothetical protein